jgi:hypothetical protein
MGSEPGSVKSKKEKAKAKVKEFQVIKYSLTAKAEGEKYAALRDKASKRYAAVVVQVLAASKEPVAFPELLKAVEGRVEKRDGKVNVEANLRWYLNDLKKRGLIKSSEDKVEAKSQDEARGV